MCVCVCVCVCVQNNMVPGISAAPSVPRRVVAVACQREVSDIVSYTREMTRTLEPQALAMGKRLLESMERRRVFPRYGLFIVVVVVVNIIIVTVIILLMLYYYYYCY